MKTILSIAKKELRIALREKVLISLGLIIFILLTLSLYAGFLSYQQQEKAIAEAQKEKRKEWLGQGDKHPHIAAHFGTYIFKPKTVLSLFDSGLDAFTGTSVYLEAHYQHEFMFRPAQGHSSMIRFGELSAALVLQILLPLLIIFLAFASFTKEKESGTLKLLSSQGISFNVVAAGKILAYLIVLLLLLMPFLAFLFIFPSGTISSGAIPDVPVRVLFLALLYGLYLFIFIALCVLVSLLSPTERNALLVMLACWIFFAIIIPKAVANVAESLNPLPSMKVYKEAIQADIRGGLDGQTPWSVRAANLEKNYLEKYEVDTVSQLPFNFEGVSIQAGEDYGNQVYDVHWERLVNIFHRQNRLGSFASLINPYIAIRNLSMGLAATDLHVSIDFQQKSEKYRRDLVRQMNTDMAENSKYGEFYEYRAGSKLWSEIKDFQYQAPTAFEMLSHYRIELISLLGWGTALILLLNYYSKKIKPING